MPNRAFGRGFWCNSLRSSHNRPLWVIGPGPVLLPGFHPLGCGWEPPRDRTRSHSALSFRTDRSHHREVLRSQSSPATPASPFGGGSVPALRSAGSRAPVRGMCRGLILANPHRLRSGNLSARRLRSALPALRCRGLRRFRLDSVRSRGAREGFRRPTRPPGLGTSIS